ncbi:MAG: DeoR family transcriptional regulator [Spirochaetota bacterium]
MNNRQREILKVLAEHNRIKVKQLAEKLKVSTVTVRQDLNFLEEEGFLKRIHGGVTLRDSDDISIRLTFNYEQKLRIARKASEFVQPGETIMVEGGSTNTILVKEVSKKEGITIITPNIYIARESRKCGIKNIILLGGLYQWESESLIGSLTRVCIDHVNFKKAFIGVDGFTRENGFTSKDMMRAEIAIYIASKADEVFIVTDSSKFGRVELVKLFDAGSIDYLITDEGIPLDEREFILESGASVFIA